MHNTGTADNQDSPLLDVTIYKYRELIGSLGYIACSVRHDISFIVNQLARYANAPTTRQHKDKW
jgi:DNA polymerase III epsilon subunit-like protein